MLLTLNHLTAYYKFALVISHISLIIPGMSHQKEPQLKRQKLIWMKSLISLWSCSNKLESNYCGPPVTCLHIRGRKLSTCSRDKKICSLKPGCLTVHDSPGDPLKNCFIRTSLCTNYILIATFANALLPTPRTPPPHISSCCYSVIFQIHEWSSFQPRCTCRSLCWNSS